MTRLLLDAVTAWLWWALWQAIRPRPRRTT